MAGGRLKGETFFKSIDQWWRADPRPDRLMLMRVIDGANEPVDEWEPEPDASLETARQCMEQWVETCREFARSDPSAPHTKFRIFAYRNGEQYLSTRVVIFDNDKQAEDFNSPPDESPTPKGIIQQLMRHNEMTQRHTVTMLEQLVVNYRDQMENMREELVSLRASHTEALKFREKMYDRQHEREMAKESARVQTDRVNAMLNQAMPHIGPLVRRFAMVLDKRLGDRSAPSEPQVKSEQIDLADSIRELLASIPPDKHTALFELLPEAAGQKLFEIAAIVSTPNGAAS